MENNKDGTYKVNYEPTEPGSQTVTVRLDGTEVPQSPISVEVAAGPDLSKIREGEIHQRAGWFQRFPFIISLALWWISHPAD